ncbi:hypothetical protein P0D95_27625 [Pseudomonas sp. CBSPCAW29]|nr:hypothetical protein P0D95_27625 [Pseudomonas sp. CBSPCAW29]
MAEAQVFQHVEPVLGVRRTLGTDLVFDAVLFEVDHPGVFVLGDDLELVDVELGREGGDFLVVLGLKGFVARPGAGKDFGFVQDGVENPLGSVGLIDAGEADFSGRVIIGSVHVRGARGLDTRGCKWVKAGLLATSHKLSRV